MKNINKFFILSIFIISTLLFTSCSNRGYSNINLKKAMKTINNSTNLIMLDVRTAEEYSAGNIPNSINIDVLSPDFKSKIDLLDKNKEYLVYCRSGNRSAIASSIMATNGFVKIYNLNNVNYSDFENAILTNR
ncbi:rhodanese-like domain-containing protein [Brachyspira catarrhinii]|uniref:Rhodanese-like domain-containing protein n=1 Tax=Brachyspira catarrhinii TaxID=2528966 RepID=A0ABY2TQ80_9SPIR|nr:rhodanese-like domain-containing protein [Brachyspira catarrhinii]TKZ34172.1 rhodanese-like domain-containing protein [Brachyspira catarrhinii]